MSKFEEVCLLSCEEWVDSFPDEISKHKFSKKHTEKMKEIFQTKPKENKHKLSKKIIKILLIAAILLSIATTVSAIPASREFIVKTLSDHSEYNVVDTSNIKDVTSLNLHYIPAGFEKDEDYGYLKIYKKGDKYFSVEKCQLTTNINFDTEKYDSENIKINGIDAVYFRPDNELKGIIFNNGDYIFIIIGKIDKDELVNIAQNAE